MSADSKKNEFIYRFRTINSIFKFRELEKQEIYFADPKTLNDPIEDFKDIFWHGDEILWKNLFKNYLLCLHTIYLLIRVSGEEHQISEIDIPVFTTLPNLQTQIYKDKLKRLFEDFFNHDQVKSLLKGLETREAVRRDELLIYLEIIHPICLHMIQKHDNNIAEKNRPLNSNSLQEKPSLTIDHFNLLNKIKTENPAGNEVEDFMFSFLKNLIIQSKLINQLNEKETISKNIKFYLFDFPEKYLNKIETLMFWPWYTACFTKNPNNSSTWGYYTNGHTGICLKFKVTESSQKKGIYLKTITGYSGTKNERRKQYGQQFYELHEINYNKKLEPVSFFRSIGRLPYPDLIGQWYSSEDNRISPLVEDILTSQEAWRKQYWKCFQSNITIKTSEWKHEEEVRLIHHSILEPDVPEKDRLLQYDFDDLEGIIFGIKTSDEDKIKIIRIAHDKCAETKRTNFNFYQASYDKKSGKISYQNLSSIKFTF